MRSVVAFRDLSLSNTDIDSLELIHALRGHSIAAPDSSPSVEPEKSSQVTSSDRYVSYAIHEMGDSSQERLPAAISIAADLPVYQSAEEQVVPKPFFFAHRPSIREEDITELDATDNMTSFTDEILLQRLYNPARQQREQFDASSTDEDVDDEEFEQQNLTNLHDIIDQMQQAPNQFSTKDESYQRYDLATTPSSNDDSSSSSRQQTDDVYLIPGYPGLWRPSTENAPMNYDADDERRTESKTRVSTTSSSRIYLKHCSTLDDYSNHGFRSTAIVLPPSTRTCRNVTLCR